MVEEEQGDRRERERERERFRMRRRRREGGVGGDGPCEGGEGVEE